MKYEICGGGAYGVLLAAKIAEYRDIESKEIEISVIDRAKKLLANWQTTEISGYEISGGFHGIEMPRANECYKILSKLTKPDSFIKIPNFKVLFINENSIEFNASIDDWPQDLSFGLKDFLKIYRL